MPDPLMTNKMAENWETALRWAIETACGAKLVRLVKLYYRRRDYVIPNHEEALGWLTTELAEVWELVLARKGGWKRNNPQDKRGFTPELYAEELGDVIFMALAAGALEGVDPVGAMLAKMERKLAAHLQKEGNDEHTD